MRQLKRILITLIIITVLMPALCPFKSVSKASDDIAIGTTPGLTEDQQNYLAAYVRVYLGEAHRMSPIPFVYDDINGGYHKHYFQNEALTHCCSDPEREYQASELGQRGTNRVGVTYSNRMRTVCSVFTGSMLHQALEVDIWETSVRGAGFSNPNGRGKNHFNAVSNGEALQPGDIIAWAGDDHSLIYIGKNPETGIHQWAQTNGSSQVVGISNMPGKYTTPYVTLNMINSAGKGKGYPLKASRLKPEILDPNWTVPTVTKIQWPNGSITTWSGEIADVATEMDPNQPLFYAGIADKIGSLGRTNPIKNILNMFNDVIDYLIGLVTMAVRIPFVGLAHVAEVAITGIATAVSNEPSDYVLTLEKIVYNQVKIFDVNIFNINTESDNVIATLKQNVAGWYYAFRNLVIVALLVVLIYLGIRMAITSIAEEKAQYKRMLVDWFVSCFMVFFIHYFIIAVININETFVGFFYVQAQNANMGSLYENMNVLAHSPKFTDGWYGTIMYIALVWFMIKYSWKYIKRLLNIVILTILSPIVSISYALDKIKDNRSQSLSKWLKEIAFTVLIQTVHALIYTVFMIGIVSKLTANNNILEAIGICVFLFIAIKFMDTAEDMCENIFGFKNASSTKEIMDSTFEMFAKFKILKDTALGFYKFNYKTAKLVGKYGLKMADGSVNLVGKAFPKVREAKDNMKNYVDENYIKPISEGYHLAMDGILPEGSKESPYDEPIRKRAQVTKEKIKKQEVFAKKTWNMSTGSIKSFGKGMSMIIEKPITGITYMIAGGAQAREVARLSKMGNFGGTTTGRIAQAELLELRKQDIKLQEMIDEEYSREDGILARGNKEDATKEEARTAKKLQKIINARLKQASATIKKSDIEKAIKTAIIEATHKGNNVTVETIIEILQEEFGTKVNKSKLYANLKEELKNAMIRAHKGEIESIVFGEGLIEEITQLNTSETAISTALWEDAIGEDGEIQKTIEEAIETQIDEYFAKNGDDKIDKIIQRLSIEDVSRLMFRGINKEGSIERDYSFKFEEKAYNDAVEETMNTNELESLEGLEEFTKKVAQRMTGTQAELFVPVFGGNVHTELEKIIRYS